MAAGMPPYSEIRETPFDKRLISRLQTGDPDALSTLFAMHVDRVYAFAFHLLGNREDAEEVTGEAFLRAFERASAFRGECPFRGWLFGIVRNLCRDRQRQPRLLLLEPEDSERNGDHGRGARQMETAVLVRQALADLSEDYRMALTLCDVEQWDASEVAFMLEKSLPATKSLLYRARRALKARLSELWDEEESSLQKGT